VVKSPVWAGLVAAALLAAGCTAASSPGSGTAAGDTGAGSSLDPAATTDTATDTTSDTGTDTATASATASPPASTASARPTRSTARTSFSPPPGSVSACALPYVRITATASRAASSHQGVVLQFTNTGQIACALTGYPAVAIVNSAGRVVKQAAHTPSGYLGGVRSGKVSTVYLLSGQTASALLEGETIDINGSACPAEPGLRVTPPTTRTSGSVPVRTGICGGVQVHPVVTGTTGSAG